VHTVSEKPQGKMITSGDIIKMIPGETVWTKLNIIWLHCEKPLKKVRISAILIQSFSTVSLQ
jgi:hypothetical protein